MVSSVHWFNAIQAIQLANVDIYSIMDTDVDTSQTNNTHEYIQFWHFHNIFL